MKRAHLFGLQYIFFRRLLEIDPADPFVEFICVKHGGLVRRIDAAGWFPAVGDREAEIVSFFNLHEGRVGREGL